MLQIDHFEPLEILSKILVKAVNHYNQFWTLEISARNQGYFRSNSFRNCTIIGGFFLVLETWQLFLSYKFFSLICKSCVMINKIWQKHIFFLFFLVTRVLWIRSIIIQDEVRSIQQRKIPDIRGGTTKFFEGGRTISHQNCHEKVCEALETLFGSG